MEIRECSFNLWCMYARLSGMSVDERIFWVRVYEGDLPFPKE